MKACTVVGLAQHAYKINYLASPEYKVVKQLCTSGAHSMTLSIRASVLRRREATAALLLPSLALAAACWGAAGPAPFPGAALACSRSLYLGRLDVERIIT